MFIKSREKRLITKERIHINNQGGVTLIRPVLRFAIVVGMPRPVLTKAFFALHRYYDFRF